MSDNPLQRLTSGRLLARNTVLNLVGYSAPLLVAVAAVPLLISNLGTSRFGVLTLVWVVVGYFSLIDLGMGRALIKLVSEKLGEGRDSETPPVIWTGLVLMISMGLVGAVAVALLAPWLVGSVLQIPQELRRETLYAFYMVAISVPMVIGTAGLRGVLEAQQRFGLVNAVRVPMSAFNFAGPLLVLPFTNSLFWVVSVLVAGRFAGMLVHLVLCLYTMPALRNGIVLHRSLVKPVFKLGGWMTVAHGTGSLLVSLDRFIVGAMISAAAVAYYATPGEIVGKLWFIPEALVGVLFAAFSASFLRDRERAQMLFGQGVKYIFLAVFPLTLIIVTLADEGLSLWLGAEFASNSYRILQWLALGTLINVLSFVPYALVQSAGRPDLTGKAHLAQLPAFVLLAWWLIGSYGLMGAVAAWVIRIVADALIMFYMVRWFLPIPASSIRRAATVMGTAISVMILAMLLDGLVVKAIFLAVSAAVFALVVWFFLLAKEEKNLARDSFKLVKKIRVREG